MGLFGKKKPQPQSVEATEVILDDGSSVLVQRVVDCLGDSCPRPQLMTKAAMEKAGSGEVVEVRIDNPTSVEALPPMMGSLRSTHLGTLRNGRYWQVLIRKN